MLIDLRIKIQLRDLKFRHSAMQANFNIIEDLSNLPLPVNYTVYLLSVSGYSAITV